MPFADGPNMEHAALCAQYHESVKERTSWGNPARRPGPGGEPKGQSCGQRPNRSQSSASDDARESRADTRRGCAGDHVCADHTVGADPANSCQIRELVSLASRVEPCDVRYTRNRQQCRITSLRYQHSPPTFTKWTCSGTLLDPNVAAKAGSRTEPGARIINSFGAQVFPRPFTIDSGLVVRPRVSRSGRIWSLSGLVKGFIVSSPYNRAWPSATQDPLR